MKAGIALAALAGVVAMTTAPPASARTYSIEYFSSAEVYSLCDREPFLVSPVVPGASNHGGVCIPVKPGQQVRIADVADDVNGDRVSLSYLFVDGRWAGVGDPSPYADPTGYMSDECNTCADVCGAPSGWIRVPKGARHFYVFLEGPYAGSIGCEPGYFATHGTITIVTRTAPVRAR